MHSKQRAGDVVSSFHKKVMLNRKRCFRSYSSKYSYIQYIITILYYILIQYLGWTENKPIDLFKIKLQNSFHNLQPYCNEVATGRELRIT